MAGSDDRLNIFTITISDGAVRQGASLFAVPFQRHNKPAIASLIPA